MSDSFILSEVLSLCEPKQRYSGDDDCLSIVIVDETSQTQASPAVSVRSGFDESSKFHLRLEYDRCLTPTPRKSVAMSWCDIARTSHETTSIETASSRSAPYLSVSANLGLGQCSPMSA